MDYALNIPSMLLMIGYLTTPTSSTGVSLSEFWAWVSIAVEGGVESTRLTIIDPKPEEEPFEVTLDQISYADDTATRSVVAKALRLSGFEIVAEATASPLGPRPGTMRSTFRRTEEARRRFVEDRDVRARDELATMNRRRALFDTGSPFRGRELTFDLPRSVLVEGRPVMRAIVRQGVNENLLMELRERPTIEDTLDEDVPFWKKAIGSTRVEGDELSASMQVGDVFRSEIYLD